MIAETRALSFSFLRKGDQGSGSTLGLQKPWTTSFQRSSGRVPLKWRLSSSAIESSGMRGWRA